MNYLNIYMFMAAAVILLAVFMRGNTPQNKRYIIWSCLIMFLVYGLRDTYSLGIDSSTSYMQEFHRMQFTSWSGILAGIALQNHPLWIIIVKLGYGLLGGDYQLFVSLIAAFVMLVFGRFIYRYSVSPVQSFIYYWGLWFFTFNFSALKQSVAMSIILLAFDFVLQKRLLRYLCTVLIATLFHFPAIIFLPAYWLVKLNPRGYLILLAAAFVAVNLWRDEIVRIMTQFYYEDRVFIGEDRFWTGKVLVMLALVLVAYILRTPTREDHVYSASLQFVAVATVIQLFSVYNNVFERLADYYFQYSIIAVPFIFRPREHTRREIVKTDLVRLSMYVLCALCLYRFNDVVTRTTTNLLPYKFFFQSDTGEQLRAVVEKLFL